MASTISHSTVAFTGTSASDLLRSSTNSLSGIPSRTLGRVGFSFRQRDFSVGVRIKRKRKKYDYPWNDKSIDPSTMKGGILRLFSDFRPLKEKPKPVILDFEKPLVNIKKQISDLREKANETGLDFTEQITFLEKKYQKALVKVYTRLTPIQRVYVARHPHRPTCLDHVFNITDKFIELHGDRAGYDDPAIVTGLGSIDGRTYMFIGHQKGRNTQENIRRNFAMPTPHGYRKALRLMRYADHHGFPIITFVDTPGAFADLKSEELGQGEAIAQNLRSMFGLKVPIVSVVIGEGGSGGALGIACANKLLMLENAVFYVASPEACAAILYKSAKAVPQAARRLKLTASELCKLRIADGVIPEPLGGAHADPSWTSEQIKKAIKESMDELLAMSTEELLAHRRLKFRQVGSYREKPIDYSRSYNTMMSDIPLSKRMEDMVVAFTQISKEHFSEYKEVTLKHFFLALLESAESSLKDQFTDPVNEVKKLEKIVKLLSKSPEYAKLRYKVDMLKELFKARMMGKKEQHVARTTPVLELEDEVERLKQQISDAKESSSKPTDLALDEMIEKLQIEVDMEFSASVEVMGLEHKFSVLQEEFAKASSKDQIMQPVKVDEIEKLQKEFIYGLSAAPNFASLKSKVDMLDELSKANGIEDKNSEDSTLKEEIIKKLKQVMDQPDMAKNMEALKASEELSKNPDLSAKMDKSKEETNKKIEDLFNLSDLKYVIEQLKFEVAEVLKTLRVKVKNKQEALEQKIRQRRELREERFNFLMNKKGFQIVPIQTEEVPNKNLAQR